MADGLTPTEQFVFQVCRSSFLSLWSYANPQGSQPGKELCDVLVVCDPDVLIFSVKGIKVTNHQDVAIQWDRWQRKAIDESCTQIYGAERWLAKSATAIQRDGTPGLHLPDLSRRRIHRLAVAIGSEGKVPIKYGDFGKGFVHVFDEITFNIVLGELDTITDFIAYLTDKENFHRSGTHTLYEGAEEDLLAFYLHRGRTFPSGYTQLLIGEHLWEEFIKKDQYQAKKVEDRESYFWDGLIETISRHMIGGTLLPGADLTQTELALRTLARENRFNRRLLGKSFSEFLNLSGKGEVESRCVLSPSGVVYVFLASPLEEDREYRTQKLGLRCFVARGIHPDSKTVIGIGTEKYKPNQGFSLDLLYLFMDNWSSEDQAKMEGIQKDLGYFVNPNFQSFHDDEYPSR